jgi:hypothetical protein
VNLSRTWDQHPEPGTWWDLHRRAVNRLHKMLVDAAQVHENQAATFASEASQGKTPPDIADAAVQIDIPVR